MAGFRLGLVARVRRYWPAGLVVAVAAGFVALTLMGSSAARNSLLGPPDQRPPDLELRQWYSSGGPQIFETADLERLESLDGVAWVEASLTGLVSVDGDGSFRLATTDSDPAHRHWQLVDGRLPTGPGEAVVSSQWLEVAGGVEPGESGLGRPVRAVSLPGGSATELEVVGLAGPRLKYGGYDEFSLLVTSPGQGREILGLDAGQTRGFLIKLAPGVDDSPLVRSQLGIEAGCSDCSWRAIDNFDLEFIEGATIFVGVFVLLAVLVSIFVVINIFKIILAGQVRDLATLRLLGATRGQVRGRVLGEAVLAAFVAGVLATLTVWGLVLLAVAIGGRFVDWPLYGPTLTVLDWVAPVAIGFLAGWLGSILPAYVAARRRPVEALGQAVETSTKKASLLRLIFGATLTGLALAGMLWAAQFNLDSSGAALVYGLGAIILMLGLTLFSAGLARPFGWLLGWLGRPLGGPVWRLGAGNIGRQPARSAAVANSLMIGISLITIVTVLASSFSASSQRLIDEQFPSDWVIGPSSDESFEDFDRPEALLPGQGLIDPDLAGRLSSSGLLHEPTTVHWGSTGVARALLNEPVDHWGLGRDSDAETGPNTWRSISVVGVDPAHMVKNLNWEFEPAGRDPAERLAAGEVYVRASLARRGLVAVGQTISVEYPGSDKQFDYVIGGLVDSSEQGFGLGQTFDLLLAADDYVSATGQANINFIVADAPAGQSRVEAVEVLEDFLADRPDLAVYDFGSLFKDQIDSILQIVLNVFRVLLGLSLVVAVLGIFSTLILSVGERRREMGALRAIGLTRIQTASLVVFEGVAMALFGAGLGVLAGWLGSLAIFKIFAAEPEVAETLVVSLPWVTLIVYGLIAAALGALAALIPAWLASRRSPVDALGDD